MKQIRIPLTQLSRLLCCLLLGKAIVAAADPGAADPWSKTPDRIFIGGEFWANPMEDWRIHDGAAECTSILGSRSLHSLVRALRHPSEPFTLTVRLERVLTAGEDGGAGFRLGARSEIDEYRSNSFALNGIIAGVIGDSMVLGGARADLSIEEPEDRFRLVLAGKPVDGKVLLVLDVHGEISGKHLGRLEGRFAPEELIGNVALVSNFSVPPESTYDYPPEPQGPEFRFREWTLSGKAFELRPGNRFGPILWSMYSLSDSRSEEGFVLKLSVLTAPMGATGNPLVELQVEGDGEWKSLGTARLDPDAWVATFRIPHWNEKEAVAFRAVYQEKHRDGTETPHCWTGQIQANPVGQPLRMAAMTCQNDYAFPYAPLVDNVARLDPDILFFSGDQLYETHGGFGVIRHPAERAILNYLRRFYQFGWSFRELMRDRPTLCLPDDHDVLQGNLWGEGGAEMKNPEKDPSASVLGGYVEPVRMVNVVHLTNVGHHPDPYDPRPAARGMGVYYGEVVYGNVGFAVLADRQWKSGPERINVQVGVTGEDEDPFFLNPDFNPPGLELLGERQEAFLWAWSRDWRGHTLKAVLSQTAFAGLATHQPRPDRYLKYDFDSAGWPARARNRAVELMRHSMALHISGDTHLGMLSQYGVEEQRDSNWAFCTPAIAAGWPRWWQPDVVGFPPSNRPLHGLPNTGEYLDAFGNKAYVYAVANPEVGVSTNRYEKADEKGSGFGFITFDTEDLTYTVEAYRFLGDVTDEDSRNLFPGWPVTIHQAENRGVNRIQ